MRNRLFLSLTFLAIGPFVGSLDAMPQQIQIPEDAVAVMSCMAKNPFKTDKDFKEEYSSELVDFNRKILDIVGNKDQSKVLDGATDLLRNCVNQFEMQELLKAAGVNETTMFLALKGANEPPIYNISVFNDNPPGEKEQEKQKKKPQPNKKTKKIKKKPFEKTKKKVHEIFLKKHKKKFVIGSIITGISGFLSGCAYVWYKFFRKK